MEGANEIRPAVELTVFGEKRRLEPTFETIINFEEAAGAAILNPNNWNPEPKISLLTTVLWAACGGKKTGKTVADFYPEMNKTAVVAVMSLLILINEQFQAAAKNDDAA